MRLRLFSKEELHKNTNTRRWGSLQAIFRAVYMDVIPNSSVVGFFVAVNAVF
jgi:hypothetical protein